MVRKPTQNAYLSRFAQYRSFLGKKLLCHLCHSGMKKLFSGSRQIELSLNFCMGSGLQNDPISLCTVLIAYFGTLFPRNVSLKTVPRYFHVLFVEHLNETFVKGAQSN